MCMVDTRLTSGFPPTIQQEGGHTSFWGRVRALANHLNKCIFCFLLPNLVVDAAKIANFGVLKLLVGSDSKE